MSYLKQPHKRVPASFLCPTAFFLLARCLYLRGSTPFQHCTFILAPLPSAWYIFLGFLYNWFLFSFRPPFKCQLLWWLFKRQSSSFSSHPVPIAVPYIAPLVFFIPLRTSKINLLTCWFASLFVSLPLEPKLQKETTLTRLSTVPGTGKVVFSLGRF